ncbi:MAG: ABC transporter permease subunit [Pseudomonadota bacterium]
MYAGMGSTSLNHRDLIFQSVVLVVVTMVIISVISSTRTNLEELGLSSGFAFLERATGWSYSFSLIDKSVDDPYQLTLFIGFLNSLFVGLVSIVFATLLGFAVGAARDGKNVALKAFATVHIQIFRNIPLILQVVFWYAIFIHMPGPRQAIEFFDMFFISNRGLMIPWLNLPGWTVLLIVAVLGASGYFVNRYKSLSWYVRLLLWVVSGCLVLWLAKALFTPLNEPLFTIPELKGLRFRDGLQVPVELVAMIVSIVLYGSAYIAEVVRGGLQEVPKGLIEAGNALGLSERTIWFRIKLPMALSTIIPPLGNQWIFLMKATTIGVAIGFSDLFMIVSTSITQSGQTLELIGILMAAFLLINYCIAQCSNFLNRKFQLPGR